jgi:DAPG hydrolase PhiG domain
MKRSKPIAGRYLGYREADRAAPYAHFFNPEFAPLAPHVCAALDRGGVPDVLLPDIDQATSNLFGGGAVLEDGFVLTSDGGMRVSVRTFMPAVTPAMVDWWFGWHGDAASKYKLWHPQAHVHVGWRETPPAGASGRALYVGQTSIVDEYIGSDLIRGAIRFVPPATLGFTDKSLDDDQQATIICARIGLGDAPIDIGYLAHHVRAVPGGSEMRSRFWMGGRHIGGRNLIGGVAASVARHMLRLTEGDARSLLVHCAEEMPHLARFLPALHAELADNGPAGDINSLTGR